MYRSWLDAGVFAKQGDIAEAIGVSDATVSNT